MTVIEFAEKRIAEAEESYEYSYWTAYLDGARAQATEDEKCREKYDIPYLACHVDD